MMRCVQCGATIQICDLCRTNFSTQKKIYCYPEEHLCSDCEEMNYNSVVGVETEIEEIEEK